MKFFSLPLVVILISLSLFTQAQQPTLLPLNYNPVLHNFHKNHPHYQFKKDSKTNKTGIKDTLQLPFFDDFSYNRLYPDSSLWVNNLVYIDADMPVNPPTFGAARFDQLDDKGIPYNGLSPISSGGGDTLTSQPINLYDTLGVLFTPNDSFYLSFFWQAQGRGEAPTGSAYLSLEMRKSDSSWTEVWRVTDQSLSEFRQVLLPITDTGYLHRAFQFRFIQYSLRTGNSNHWLVDYVYLNMNRNAGDSLYDDYSVQTKATSLLKNYSSMPLSHFKTDPASETADSIFFQVSNLSKDKLNIEVRHEESTNAGSLANTQFTNNAGNVDAQGFSTRRFPGIDISSIGNTAPVTINRMYELREPSVLNPNRANDSIVFTQKLDNYYAYDDGTAEAGFGWDEGVVLPGEPADMAIEFNMKVSDTLFAIGIFFNRSFEDVSNEPFTLTIWQDLNSDPIYEEELGGYDQTNYGWHYYFLKEKLVLPAGKYYIGWNQLGTLFNLNIGWDMNQGYLSAPGKPNPGISYRILGEWKSWAQAGTPMIRAYVGETKELSVPQKKAENNLTLKAYPNPSRDLVRVECQEKGELTLFNMHGQVVGNVQHLSGKPSHLQLSELPVGIYYLNFVSSNGQKVTKKIIKQP